MEKITYRFSLDTHRNGVQKTIQGFETRDNVSRLLEITLTEGSKTYLIPTDGTTAVMNVLFADGSTDIVVCEIEDNKILVDTTNITKTNGTVECQIQIIGSKNKKTFVLAAPRFALEVWNSIDISDDPELVEKYSALVEALKQAKEYSDHALEKIEVDEDFTLRFIYKNGVEYTNDTFKDAISRLIEEEQEVLREAQEYTDATRIHRIAASVSASEAAESANSAKDSADSASDSASAAAGSASEASTKATQATQAAESANTNASSAANAARLAENKAGETLSYAQSANTSANKAQASATSADSKAKIAEGYAMGTQDGVDVGPDSPYYQNNAKYYSEQADVDGRVEQLSESVSDLKNTLNEQQTEIDNKYDKVYTSGTDGTLTDSDNGLLKNLIVKGNAEQKSTSGKNLFINEVWKDGYDTSSGTVAIYDYVTYKLVNVVSGQQYTISCNNSSGNNYYRVQGYKDGTWVERIGNASASVTITIPSGVNQIALFAPKTNNTITNTQIELGTERTAYEEYTGGLPSPSPSYPQPIRKVVNPTISVRNKNLINSTNAVKHKWLYQVDGTAISDDSTAYYPDWVYVGDTDRITISNAKSNMWFALCFYDANKEIISAKGVQTRLTNGAYIANVADAEYVRLSVELDCINSTQMEYGRDATPFVEHKEKSVTIPTTLYGIGNVHDTIDVERGKIVRKFATVDLGSFDYNINAGNFFVNDAIHRKISSVNALCNIYKANSIEVGTIGGLTKDKTLSFQASNDNRIIIRDTSYTDASSFKSAMTSHGATLVYELATPTEEDIPSETLTTLRELMTYYPSTSVSITSEEINGSATFDYPLNLQSFISNVRVAESRMADTEELATEAYLSAIYAESMIDLNE